MWWSTAAPVLITRGSEGMTLLENGKFSHLPAYAKGVVDVTGASDTVAATLALALAGWMSLKNAAELASHAAAVAIGKVGTAAVSPEELKNHFIAHCQTLSL